MATSGTQITARKAKVVAAIKEIRSEHNRQAAEKNEKVQSISLLETMLSLGRLEASLATDSREKLIHQREKIEDFLGFIEASIRPHAVKEEKVICPLLSETLKRALLAEHQKFQKMMEEIRSLMTEMWKEGVSFEVFAGAHRRVQTLVRELDLFLQEHTVREEAILNLLLKGLEKGGPPGEPKSQLGMLTGIKKVESEHSYLRGLYTQGMEVLKEFDLLTKCSESSVEGMERQVGEGRKRIEEMIATAEKAFQTHFAMEEEVLAPVFGGTLIQGLHVEHEEIWKLFGDFKIAVMRVWQEKGTSPEFREAKVKIGRLLDDFTSATESSAKGEESIMKMAAEVLI